MEKEQRQAKLSVKKFSYALTETEKSIRPLLSALDTLRTSSNEGELDALSRARMHITMCYTINSLFVMYLRTQGMDPLSHPVSDEIERVQDAFMRFRKVEAGISTDYQAPPDRDRRKHIVNAKKATAKLASSILPEEALLVAALKGNGRKRKREDEKEEGSGDEENDDAGDVDTENGGEIVEVSDDGEDKDIEMKEKPSMENENSEEEPSAKKKKKKKDKKDRKNKKAKKEKTADEGDTSKKVVDSEKEVKTPKDKKKKKKDKKRKSS